MQTSNKEEILSLKNLTIDFGGLRAVDNVDLSINSGELRGLIGPNGAGKSTVFKLIMGIYPPTQGKVLFKGNDITNIKSWQRARMGIAAQNYFSHKDIDGEIKRLVTMIGIENLLDQEVNNLSHGQQQWLEIAMTLSSNPELLLLDEPAAGMGPEETLFTAKIVKKLNENGVSIIFIDHDMEFVRQLSRQITVLHQGAVFAEGNIEDIESNQDVIEIYLGSNS